MATWIMVRLGGWGLGGGVGGGRLGNECRSCCVCVRLMVCAVMGCEAGKLDLASVLH